MNDNRIRMVRKRFKCIKCHEYESKLVRPNATRIPCTNCQGILAEVHEKEYQLHKKKVNTSEINTTKSLPIKPTKEHYKDQYENNKHDNIIRHSTNDVISNSNYDRTPSNLHPPKIREYKNNDNYFRSSSNNFSNENESKNDYQGRGRYQSNDDRSNMNNNRRYNTNSLHNSGNNHPNRKSHINQANRNTITYNNNNNNDNDYNPRQRQYQVPHYDNMNNNPNESNGFNLNTILRNIFNQDNIGGREANNEARPGNHHGPGSRTRSVDPIIHLHNPQGVFVIRSTPNYMPVPFGNTFFQNFFGELAMTPFNQPQVFSMPFNIRVQRHNFNEEDIFDPQFATFGSTLNGFFLDNFASNFRSNLEDVMFEQLINMIQDNLLQAESRKSKKTKKEALNALKKFDMTEKYCKKNKNGKLEYPNCSICLSDINKGENTVLLPCGHIFHWKCCHSWLKDNNTCPVCRFELPAENGNRER